MQFRICLTIFIYFLLTQFGFAQDPNVDSLKSVLENLKDDSAKVNALNELSSLLYTTQPDIAIMYAVESQELGEKIRFYKGVALALKYIGLGYYTKADYIETIEYWKQSMAVYDSIGDKSGVSNLLNNLGTVYYDQGDEATGVEYYLSAARTAEEVQDKYRMSNAYFNIGAAYATNPETYNLSLEYFMLAYNFSEEFEDYYVVGLAAANIGELFFLEDKYDSALIYYEKSLEAYDLTEGSGAPYTLNNIGKLYAKMGEYPAAIKFHQDAFEMALKFKDKAQQAQSLNGIGDVYLQEKNYKSALDPYLEAEKLAKDIGTPDEMQRAYEGLAIAYSELGKYTNAFRYQALLTEINYELYDAENNRKIERLQFTYEIENKENEINRNEKTTDHDIRNPWRSRIDHGYRGYYL
jgi:tetratricopeptide (TPR) repeat protein